jgi:hypothetical protein
MIMNATFLLSWSSVIGHSLKVVLMEPSKKHSDHAQTIFKNQTFYIISMHK